ncbi:2OG-Fe(II) oxygenase [Pseudomonas sp. NW5]|uniref:2OG-Fe(II) oxygenase n=1 Tax=Pseudomonas sp. NW5 TaxID=2934934 RepID=UPI0020205969|nr:2OG-Fe(II) oxygenase [Pseudomonas sp. NW5]MCL7462148.1 2OG-Fe(II) oxygenase [Pseudomonas sp. NW5]
MPAAFSPDLLDALIDDLARQGWSQQRHALSAAQIAALADECRARHARGELQHATIGRAATQTLDAQVRGDHIQWLERGRSTVTDAYLEVLDNLRETLNRTLYLGLEDYESHFALYPPGSFYHRHLDRFRDDDRRMVTTILYLNEDWRAEDGGALQLELGEGRSTRILPEAGTLVVFMAGDFPHEVLLAQRERLSITGWFRRRGVGMLG